MHSFKWRMLSIVRIAVGLCVAHSGTTLFESLTSLFSFTPPTKSSNTDTDKTRWNCGFALPVFFKSRAETSRRLLKLQKYIAVTPLEKRCPREHGVRFPICGTTSPSVLLPAPFVRANCCSPCSKSRRSSSRQEEEPDRNQVPDGAGVRDWPKAVLVGSYPWSARNRAPQAHEGCHSRWTLPSVLFLSPLPQS